jgi:hypothetical protein
MKLIVVARDKKELFERLLDKFVDDLNVSVVWDRRKGDRRRLPERSDSNRRRTDRRTLTKPWSGRDYIVIHVVEDRRPPG